MVDVKSFIDAIFSTFDKSAAQLFDDWMALRPATRKWMIAADFALRDRSRPGDCFAFSIVPYERNFEEYKLETQVHLPKDLKDSRELHDHSASWIRDNEAFHIIFPINADRKFYFDGDRRDVDVARESLELTTKMLIELDREEETVRKFRRAVQKSKANGFPLGLFTDLTILSLLLPVVSLLIARRREPEVLGWMCDRDSMTSWGDGIVWELANENLLGLASNLALPTDKLRPLIALPDKSRQGEEAMWFDHLVRTPDWLAGTLAAWDWSNNDVSDHHPKYLQMIENVCADATNIVILPISMTRQGANVFRLVVEKPSTDDDAEAT